MKLTIDDVVICLALLLGFATSLAMAIANQGWGTHFPSSLIAFFAAVSVAALIYRFLGGAGDSQFRMGVLQVTGSAAILLGATWLLGDKVKAETALFATDALYRPALETKQNEIESLKAQLVRIAEDRDSLQSRIGQLGSGKTEYSIEQVRKMRPDDDFVSGIRRMVSNEDPPFRETMRDLGALVTLNDSMTNVNVYRICADTQDKLFVGLNSQKDRLRIRHNYGDGESAFVDATRGGTILTDSGACSTKGQRTFDIQITCADAIKLFPDKIQRCQDLKAIYRPNVGTIRGDQVVLGALPPR